MLAHVTHTHTHSEFMTIWLQNTHPGPGFTHTPLPRTRLCTALTGPVVGEAGFLPPNPGVKLRTLSSAFTASPWLPWNGISQYLGSSSSGSREEPWGDDICISEGERNPH